MAGEIGSRAERFKYNRNLRAEERQENPARGCMKGVGHLGKACRRPVDTE